jgi:hypothetical protein
MPRAIYKRVYRTVASFLQTEEVLYLSLGLCGRMTLMKKIANANPMTNPPIKPKNVPFTMIETNAPNIVPNNRIIPFTFRFSLCST